MTSVDVTVRGGGAFGLACAWACARRGARVRLIEWRRIGAGASGGLVGALAPHAPEGWNTLKAFQFDSLLMAGDWWDAVRSAGGVDPGYLRSGRLQPLADAAAVALARTRAEAARSLWQGRAEWRIVPAGRHRWEPASPSGWLVHDTLTARMSPRRAGAALVAALHAAGAEVLERDAGEAGAVIHATGWRGLEDLSLAFGRKIGGGVKGQAALLDYDARDQPQIYGGGLHVVPHADGTVAIGSTSEPDWTSEAPDRLVEALIERARKVLPILQAAPVLERWAGIRPRATTRSPVLGAWPGRPGHFIANGGFKIGFGLAPLVAERMADLVLDGRDDLPKAFHPETLLAGSGP